MSYVDGYSDGVPKLKDCGPTVETLEEYRAAVNTFFKIVGVKPLSALTVDGQDRFEDVNVKLPVNRTRLAESRDLSIDEMLQLCLRPISLQHAKQIAGKTSAFVVSAFRDEGSKPPFQLLDRVRASKKKHSRSGARSPMTNCA